ncbi:protein kintoun [Microcaecilia unicolor]|uniref:Protein kintoun n=1 Tax=Microcaecilia unicolor TaxID=1415580 RepID=A0A6P7Z6J2_9AMPH|nr:protein kintoun [Microcaecilia unicolor]
MATRSKLEDLDLTTEEVERLSKAFKDEKFRELFQAYADEISDPENKKKYEEEITLMEKERGMDVKFVHPQPGHVLKTSLNGVQQCYINVCSNELIQKPGCKAGEGKGNRKGQHWSLPYSLAPGREDLCKEGRKHMIYDVVFHPETLYIAGQSQRFKQMVDSTAVEAIEKQFGVKLDEKNAKVLKLKYKGVPQAAVLRTPLPSKPQQAVDDADDPLRFPNPYETDKCGFPRVNTNRKERGQTEAKKHATVAHQTDEDRELKLAKPTTPRYTVVHRSHFDLQDYRYARDATPGPIPKELIVTIDLPLLKSAEQATLDVTEKHLSLESRKPDYCLQISLPYRVDENQGTAKFNKAKKQLVITLPVVPQMSYSQCYMTQDQKLVSDAPKNDNDGVNHDLIANEPADGAGSEVKWQAESVTQNSEEETQSGCPPAAEPQMCVKEKLQNRAMSSERELVKDQPEKTVGKKETTEKIEEGTERDSTHLSNNFSDELEKSKETTTVSSQEDFSEQSNLQTNELIPTDGKNNCPKCPKFQCIQDNLSISLVLHVLNIEKESLKEDVDANQYSIRFCSRDNILYYLIIQFPPHKLNTKGTTVSISKNNAVIQLSKSSESTGHWRKLYFGLNSDSLQEKLFVSEGNVDEFLEDVLHAVDMKQSASWTQPLIEVLKVTDSHSHIRLKEHEPNQRGQKEEGATVTATSEVLNGDNPGTESAVVATDSATGEHSVEDNEALTLPAVLGSESLLHPKSSNGSLSFAEECQVSEPKCDPAAAGDISAASVSCGKETFPQFGEAADKNELYEDDALIKQQDGDSNRVLTSGTVAPSIKEINTQDGSVQVITDHTTHCAFTFQNSLLYDLD